MTVLMPFGDHAAPPARPRAPTRAGLVRRWIAAGAGVDASGLKGAQVLAARLVGAVLAYAAQVCAARYLGQDGFGIYALALVWLTLLGHLATLGTPQAICRFVAAGLATGDHAAVRGFIAFGLGFVLVSGAVIGTAAALLLLLSPGLVEGSALWPLVLAVLAAPLLAVQDNLESVARAFDRPLLGIAPAYCVRHGTAVAIFAILAISGIPGSPALAVAAAIAALCLGILIQVAVLVPAVRARVPAGPRRYDVRVWLGMALPVALVDGTEILMLNADVLLVGLFLPTPTVAAYFAATRLTQILDYVRYAASAATAQRFAALSAMGERVELSRLAALTTLATAALAGLAAVMIVGGAPLLLGLFGPGFADAAGIVPILAAGMVIACLCGPGEDILTMLGQERACAVVFAVALVLNLALNVILIPRLGLTGAAVATAATMMMRAVTLAGIAYLRLGIVLPFGLALAMPTRR